VGLGCAVALWLYEMNEGLHTSKTAFILFIGKKNKLLILKYKIIIQ
jgi:hypothetical protein